MGSTSMKFLGEAERKRSEHGVAYRRQWRKVHLGIDVQKLEIRVIEVTDNSVGDTPTLTEMLRQIPSDKAVVSVNGDGPSVTKTCHAVWRSLNAGRRR